MAASDRHSEEDTPRRVSDVNLSRWMRHMDEVVVPHLYEQTAELSKRTQDLQSATEALMRSHEDLRADVRELPVKFGQQFEAAFTRVVDDDKRLDRIGEKLRDSFMKQGKLAAGGWMFGILRSGWTWVLMLVVSAKVMGWGPAWDAMKNIKP